MKVDPPGRAGERSTGGDWGDPWARGRTVRDWQGGWEGAVRQGVRDWGYGTGKSRGGRQSGRGETGRRRVGWSGRMHEHSS